MLLLAVIFEIILKGFNNHLMSEARFKGNCLGQLVRSEQISLLCVTFLLCFCVSMFNSSAEICLL